MVRVAKTSARRAGARPAPLAVRALPAESRPGRELVPRAAAARADQRTRAACAYRTAAARPADTDAVPGSGIRRIVPLPLLRRPSARADDAGPRGARQVP